MKPAWPARIALIAALSLPLVALPGCVAQVGPVEVTRFHVPEVLAAPRGTIAVEPAVGSDPASLEFRSYAMAVSQELARLGYAPAPAGQSAPTVALLSVERATLQADRGRNPVSVGVGGGTGGFGSGVGLGVGFDLSGPPPAQIETRMQVMIRDRASDRTLWEGRAAFSASAKSPLAQTQLAAAKMARALFKDYPGRSGETIEVP